MEAEDLTEVRFERVGFELLVAVGDGDVLLPNGPVSMDVRCVGLLSALVPVVVTPVAPPLAFVAPALSTPRPTGDPGRGAPPDGKRVGEFPRWLCPLGFAACARVTRVMLGLLVDPGRTRDGAIDPRRVAVRPDADTHDAAMVIYF